MLAHGSVSTAPVHKLPSKPAEQVQVNSEALLAAGLHDPALAHGLLWHGTTATGLASLHVAPPRWWSAVLQSHVAVGPEKGAWTHVPLFLHGEAAKHGLTSVAHVGPVARAFATPQWQVAATAWWQVAGGRWRVAGGRHCLISAPIGPD